MSSNPNAGGAQAVQAGPGDWTEVGEFTARFKIYYGWGHDGKPMVRIVPVTQRGRPLIAQPTVVPQQQRYVREGNEHRGATSRRE
ncbi:MAG: hypothetical protein JSW71_06780 [Gemmatimonadota bacterium]|nr:MAG: hypothetical protein JSW71_06780 [Gemmatimonadota bacterium]